MKGKWSVIRLGLVLLLTGVLFGFTQQRNATRTLTKMTVAFVDDSSPFITVSTVNKLLIQINDSVTSIPKETLVLKEMESRLVQNPMVYDAQVFVTVDGRLGAKIEQRNPIARVSSSPDFYIDEEGKMMPLSKVYSARVPIVTGASKANFEELTPLLLKIRADEFMNKSVVGIHQSRGGKVSLRMRKMDFDVSLGTPKDLDRKFKNFKVFYQKVNRDDKLRDYSLVNLQFGNQVVATKK